MPSLDREKALILEYMLNMYGMSHNNLEYYTDRTAYDSWYQETLTKLKDLVFTDHLGCYKKICEFLKANN